VIGPKGEQSVAGGLVEVSFGQDEQLSTEGIRRPKRIGTGSRIQVANWRGQSGMMKRAHAAEAFGRFQVRRNTAFRSVPFISFSKKHQTQNG